MNIGTSLKTISKDQLCSFVGTGGYVELAETDVLSDGSIVTVAAMLPLLNSGNDKRAGILPPGYQKVEFLESSGTQYIDTDIVPQGDTRMFIDAGQISGNEPINTLVGCRNTIAGRNSDFHVYVLKSNPGKIGLYPYVTTPLQDLPTGQFTAAFTGNTIEIDGAFKRSYTPVQDAVETNIPVRIFAMNYGNGTKSQFSIFKLYRFSLSSPTATLLNFVPALDKDGTPCMFDMVTKKSFYNANTGRFRIGIATLQQAREFQLPDNTGNAVRVLLVSLPQEARTDFIVQNHLDYLTSLNWSINVQYRDGDIPSDYTKVDFLKSSGSQYIDTGIATDGNYTISCRLQVSSAGAVWGRACTPPYEEYTGGQSWARFLAPSESNKGLWFYYNYVGSAFSNNADRPPMWDTSIPHDWVAVEGEKTVILDGESVTLGSQFNYAVNVENPDQRTHYIFAANGEYIYGTGKAPMKLYSFTMQDGDDKTVLDLIPVINENGVPGMWDRVGKKFLANSGTGAFVAGIKTLNDVRMLDKALPAVPDGSTYSITLSLPVEASTDALAQQALKDLAARRWSVSIQYREEEIPAGYAKVAFLESSGTQYIDTGVVTDGTYTIAARMQLLSSNKDVWGRRSNSGNAEGNAQPYGNSVLNTYDTTKVVINYVWRGYNRNSPFDLKQTHDYVVTEGQKAFIVDGVSQTISGLNQWTVKSTNLDGISHFLFWSNKSNDAARLEKASASIYSFRMQDGSGSTVLDLIPVINTAGIPGMYDKVSKQFFENVGTGQFRVGLASKEAVRNLYLEPEVPAGTTIDLSVPAGTTEEDTRILKANNPNYTFNIQYRS